MRMPRGIIVVFIIILSISGCVSNNQNWRIKETEHLIIYYKPDSLAAREIDTAAKTYEEVCNRAIQMLKSTDTFNKKINCYLLETMPQWTGKVWGYAVGSTRSVYYYYSDRKKFISAHEMMHILLNDINTNVPSSLQEGVCRFYEKRTIIMTDFLETIDTKEYSCEVYRLAKFEPPNKWTVENVFSSPVIVNEAEGNISAAFVSFLINYMGDELFYYLYRKVDSASWENVLTTTLHLSVNEINQAFHKYGKSLRNPSPAITEYYGRIIPPEWEK
ncbi:MAG: hypothetical protein V1871_03510 [Planctomycetota bacterium]